MTCRGGRKTLLRGGGKLGQVDADYKYGLATHVLFSPLIHTVYSCLDPFLFPP